MQITALKNLNLNIRRAKLGKSSGSVNSFFITEVGVAFIMLQGDAARVLLLPAQWPRFYLLVEALKLPGEPPLTGGYQ
jgi:hypothetical protein